MFQFANLVINKSSNHQPMAVCFPKKEDANQPLAELCANIRAERPQIRQKLYESGHIRLRGFPILGAQDFEKIALALDSDLKNGYLGTSPRYAQSEFVFSASELPPHFPIAQHIEMSFLPSAPRMLMFHCVQPSAWGGETPMTDFRQVWADLDSEIKKVFLEKNIQNVRNYSGPSTPKKRDLWQLKRWDEMFQTTNKALIEQKAAEQGLRCEWGKDDRLRLLNTQTATRSHPNTGETVWFNHVQVFHALSAKLEYQKIHAYQNNVRSFFYKNLTNILTHFKQRENPMDQALHCTFGDGSEIPKEYLAHIVEVIWKNMVIEPWQKGDVVIIDNYSTAHGRLPYSGPRNIQVAWTGV